MSLEITQGRQEGIAIFDLKGRLVIGEEELQFRGALDRLVRAGENRLVLNLDDVDEIDTASVTALLFALATLRKARGGLAIVNVKPPHIATLVESRLAAVFDIFKEDQDAIDSFFPDREFHYYDILEFMRSTQAASAAS